MKIKRQSKINIVIHIELSISYIFCPILIVDILDIIGFFK